MSKVVIYSVISLLRPPNLALNRYKRFQIACALANYIAYAIDFLDTIW
jgi:predicted nucleic-acid-binding protein